MDAKRKELACITLRFFSEFCPWEWDLNDGKWDLEKNGLGNRIGTHPPPPPPFRTLLHKRLVQIYTYVYIWTHVPTESSCFFSYHISQCCPLTQKT